MRVKSVPSRGLQQRQLPSGLTPQRPHSAEHRPPPGPKPQVRPPSFRRTYARCLRKSTTKALPFARTQPLRGRNSRHSRTDASARAVSSQQTSRRSVVCGPIVSNVVCAPTGGCLPQVAQQRARLCEGTTTRSCQKRRRQETGCVQRVCFWSLVLAPFH